ncbi:hypothetical protein BT63DRAFT_458928 [Microthyrium microscopicum]|uniref:GPI-anchored cell wall organization protein Ecm33 n=1 Tax=Microthyrium microscopicum TaxID=703497 RepID=A0A6A6TZ49_9PEZI|nr:hypothetical protein BT63DRAFT_458928 [Microthyrium microscopicum]
MMFSSKFFGAVLAIASVAHAADSGCSSSSTLQIQNQGDTSSLQGCTTYTGNVQIASQTSGIITLNGVTEIDGDFVVDGATNMSSLAAPSLQTITGKFTLNNLQTLSSLSMPKLTSVGDLTFAGLPNLASLGFDGIVKQCKTLNIQNTFLSSLNGINLQTVNSVTIANNRMLQTLMFQVTSVPQSIILLANGDQFDASFPNLETASNITFRSCKSLSIPSLKNVTGNLGFYENSFATLDCANLTSVGQTLAINANPSLTEIDLPILKTIGGGFQVQNNTKLDNATFPAVQTIGGALDFYGGFNTVGLPALKDCRGGFNLQSSGSVDCTPFNNEKGPNSVIKGTFKCYNKVSNPGNAASTPSGGNGTTTKGAAALLSVPSNTMLMSMAGILAGLMIMM